jgi:GxxExxY protein
VGGDRRALGKLSRDVIGALVEVHRHLGPGLLESAYETCVQHELVIRGFAVERQRPVPISYKRCQVDAAYRADLLVEGQLLIELKAVDSLSPIHVAQVITYLRLARLDAGLLVNFNVPKLAQGLRRIWLPASAA